MAEDAIVVVRGRLEKGEEEAPRVRAMEVSIPNLSEGSAGPVELHMDITRCTPPVVERLRETLSSHPGTAEVYVHLREGSRRRVLLLPPRLRVAPSPALYGDLKVLLGPNCLG